MNRLFNLPKTRINMDRRTVIIDGYNLIKSPQIEFPKLESLEAQRDHLLKILHSSLQLKNERIMVVFDGSPKILKQVQSKYRGIRVVFSGDHKSADRVIQELIRREPQPSHLEIVTSDREIQFTARDHGARVSDSPAFWKRLHSGKKQTSPSAPSSQGEDRELSDREVSEWLELFKNRTFGDNEN